MAFSPLRQVIKKPRLSVNLDKCLICQANKAEPLRNASDTGKATFLRVIKLKKEAGELREYDQLQTLLNEDDEGYTFTEPRDIKWHKSCYSTLTSSTNISHLSPKEESKTISNNDIQQECRVQRANVNWSVCFFCHKMSHNKDRKLIKVSTDEFCSTLEKKALALNDFVLLSKVGDFSKLHNMGAQYHKACHSNYLKRNVKEAKVEDKIHDKAFDDLMSNVMPMLDDGRAIDMNEMLSMYQECHRRYIGDEENTSYAKHHLKAKLLSRYGEQISYLAFRKTNQMW